MKNRFTIRPLEKTLKEIFVPSWPQIGFFLSTSIITVFLIFFDKILKQILDSDATAQQYFEQSIDKYLKSLSEVPFAEYTTSILFWAVIGIIAYAAVLLIINTAIAVVGNATVRKQEKIPGLFDSFSLVDEYRRLVWILLVITVVFLSFGLVPVWFSAIKAAIVDLNLLYFTYGLSLLAYSTYLTFMTIWTAFRNPNILARN